MCRNFSKEVLLTWSNFQAKIPSRSGVSVHGSAVTHPPNDKGLKDTDHMSSFWCLTQENILYLVD